MRKVFFLTAFFLSISMIGYSQLTVINNTSDDLVVTVQYVDVLSPPCGTEGDVAIGIPIDSGDDDTVGSGDPIYRVGVVGAAGNDWSSPCLDCGEGPGPYVFIWGPACGTVIIN